MAWPLVGLGGGGGGDGGAEELPPLFDQHPGQDGGLGQYLRDGDRTAFLTNYPLLRPGAAGPLGDTMMSLQEHTLEPAAATAPRSHEQRWRDFGVAAAVDEALDGRRGGGAGGAGDAGDGGGVDDSSTGIASRLQAASRALEPHAALPDEARPAKAPRLTAVAYALQLMESRRCRHAAAAAAAAALPPLSEDKDETMGVQAEPVAPVPPPVPAEAPTTAPAPAREGQMPDAWRLEPAETYKTATMQRPGLPQDTMCAINTLLTRVFSGEVEPRDERVKASVRAVMQLDWAAFQRALQRHESIRRHFEPLRLSEATFSQLAVQRISAHFSGGPPPYMGGGGGGGGGGELSWVEAYERRHDGERFRLMQSFNTPAMRCRLCIVGGFRPSGGSHKKSGGNILFCMPNCGCCTGGNRMHQSCLAAFFRLSDWRQRKWRLCLYCGGERVTGLHTLTVNRSKEHDPLCVVHPCHVCAQSRSVEAQPLEDMAAGRRAARPRVSAARGAAAGALP